MTSWKKVATGELPPMNDDPCGPRSSIPVLGFVYGDTMMAVVLQQWEDESPKWYSNCSEHWDLGDRVSHWMHFPAPPTS